ncbi:MAG: YdcF family protein [Actinobacteria bacterium]|nr:YdcF family protein [Actinomycetota bacterium]
MKKKFLAAAGVIIAVLVLTSGLWLTAYGRFLVVDEKPAKCDAIVVLGGETVPRVGKSVELFKEGYGDKIIMSGGGRLTTKLAEADLMLMEARDLGVDPSAVLLERESESTYENAVLVKQIVMEKRINSFLLVTSNYHTRRARQIFNKVFDGTGVRIITVSASDPKFRPDYWWKSGEGQQKALTELANIVVYWIKY